MKLWQSDEELFSLARQELFVAVVGDIMDQMGRMGQFLPPQIQPVAPQIVVIGRAMPVLEADVFSEKATKSANPLLSTPFGLMLAALDDLKLGEVYVASGGSPAYACWGELMST